MSRSGGHDWVPTLGRALGAGLAFIPLLGIPARYLLPELGGWLTYGAAFVAGGALALLIGLLRTRKG